MECVSHDSGSTNAAICSRELTNSSGNSKPVEMHAHKNEFETSPHCEQNGQGALKTSNKKNEEKNSQMNYSTHNDQPDNFTVTHTYSATSQKSRKFGRTKNFSKNKADFNNLFYEEKYVNSNYVENGKRSDRHFTHGGPGSNRGLNDNHLRKGTSLGNCSSGNNNMAVHNAVESFGMNYSCARMNVANDAEEKFLKRVAINNENLVLTADKSNLGMVDSRSRRRGANSEKQPFVFTNKRGTTGSYNGPNDNIVECANVDDRVAVEHLGVDGNMCGDIINGEGNSKKNSFLRKSKSLNRNNIYERKEDNKRLVSIMNRDTAEGMDYMDLTKKACSNNELKFKEKKKDEANCTSREANYDFKSALNVQFSKTKMCPYMNTKEKCKRFLSNMCPYAHDQSELKPFPDLYKTAMCRNFMKNLCNKSKVECNFAHDVEELRSTDEFYKTTLCKFFLNGYCKADTNCRHAHGHKELKCKEAKCTDAKGTEVNDEEMNCKEVNCEEMNGEEMNGEEMNGQEMKHRNLGSLSWESERVDTEKANNNDKEEQLQNPHHHHQQIDMQLGQTLINGENMNQFKSSESCSLSEGKEVRMIREGEDFAEEDLLVTEDIEEHAAVMDVIAVEGKHISNTRDRKKNDSKKKKEIFNNVSRKLMSISTKDTYSFLSNGLSRNMESSENVDDENKSVRTNDDSTLPHSNGDSKIRSSDSENSCFKGDANPEYQLKSNEAICRMEVKDQVVSHSCVATGREAQNASVTEQGGNSVDHKEQVTTIAPFGESHNTTDGKQEGDSSSKLTCSNTNRGSNVVVNRSVALKKEGRKIFNDDNANGSRHKVSVGGVGKGSNDATIHPKMERNKNARGYMNPNFTPIGSKGGTRDFQDNMGNGKLGRNVQIDTIEMNDEMRPPSEMHFSTLCDNGMYGYDGAVGHTGNCDGRDNNSGYVQERGEKYTLEGDTGEYNRIGYQNRGLNNTDKGIDGSVFGASSDGGNVHSGSNNNFNGPVDNGADNYNSGMSKHYGNGKRANGGTTRYDGHIGSMDSSNNGVANSGAANRGFADNAMGNGGFANNRMMGNNQANNNPVNSNMGRKNLRNTHARNTTRNVRNSARNNMRNGGMATYGAYPNDLVENNMRTMHCENVNTYNGNFSCYSVNEGDANVYMNVNNFPYNNITQGFNCNVVGGPPSRMDHTNYGGNYGANCGSNYGGNYGDNYGGNYGGHYGNLGSGPDGGNHNPYLPQDYAPPICNNIMKQSRNYKSKKRSVQNNMPYGMSNNGNFEHNSGCDRNGNIYGGGGMKQDLNYNSHGFSSNGMIGSMNIDHFDGNMYGDMFMNNGPRNNHHDCVNNMYDSGNGNNYYPYGYDTSGTHVMNIPLENSADVHSGHMYNTMSAYDFSDGQNGEHDGMQNGAHHGAHISMQNRSYYGAHNGMQNNTPETFRQMDKKANSGNMDAIHGGRNRKGRMSNNTYKDTYKGADENFTHAINGADGAQLGQPFACNPGVHDETNLDNGSFLSRKTGGCPSNSVKSGHMTDAAELKRNNYDETNLGTKKSEHIGKSEKENRTEGRSGEHDAKEMNRTAYCSSFNAKGKTDKSEQSAQLQDNNRGNSKECNTRHNRNGSKNGRINDGMTMRDLDGSTNRSTLKTLAACISPVNGPGDQSSLCEGGQMETCTVEKMKPNNYDSTGERFKSGILKGKIPRGRGLRNRREQPGEYQSRGEYTGTEQNRGEKNQEEIQTQLQIPDHQGNCGMINPDNKIESFLMHEEPQTCVSCCQCITDPTQGELIPTNPCGFIFEEAINKSLSLMIIELLQPQVQHLLSDVNFYVQNYYD
ncbi:hypothetical protein AK88_02815 [Plasmodium fragile]|uniref:C3H1-type domain-containing protein n=1 Tax=Plasmodium fragile TaxID=5857 RepID=A0A0D9QP70_PLAFR|nr:uncharacterized protein AK88_02815 [Plasmodium fragile]KJP87511.1 hypothetical protein AK88_02815 [Plasmodium fragile]